MSFQANGTPGHQSSTNLHVAKLENAKNNVKDVNWCQGREETGSKQRMKNQNSIELVSNTRGQKIMEKYLEQI